LKSYLLNTVDTLEHFYQDVPRLLLSSNTVSATDNRLFEDVKLIWEDPPLVSVRGWGTPKEPIFGEKRVGRDPCNPIFVDLENDRWLEKQERVEATFFCK